LIPQKANKIQLKVLANIFYATCVQNDQQAVEIYNVFI